MNWSYIFPYKGKYFYKNIKYIPSFFYEIYYLLRWGHPTYATWETFPWFIDSMSHILKDYKLNHVGVPYFGTEDDEEKWENVLDEMLQCLEIMKTYDSFFCDIYTVNKAKKTFFNLFDKYFWMFWD